MLLSYRRWHRNEPSPLISPPTKTKSVASRNSRLYHGVNKKPTKP
ncbi:unnamed protein product [Brassica oleracea var. botrytis]